MENSRKISEAVINRLPRYYRYLGELLKSGVDRISSKDLSIRMKVTASQIRQDLNNFGGFGQQGYGYNVAYLHEEISKILGVDTRHSMIIVGAGNLGQALANYQDFEKKGFFVKGVFDNNRKLKGKSIRGIKIRMTDEMESFIAQNRIEIAALTLPEKEAKAVAARLEAAGIQAIWNFAHTDLHTSASVVVENVHLSESLMRLSYKLANRH